MKIAIIGCGLMGTSAARWLSKRRHEVTAFEQFEFGHELGSSHGSSRIVRKAYVDPLYTEILLEAYPLWHDLQEEAGERMLYEVGLTYMGSVSDPEMQSQIRGLTDLCVPFQLLHKGETTLRLEDNEVGVFTPEAGWVHPPTVLESQRRIAEKHRAKFVHKRIESLEELSGFDKIVVTAGSWVRMFIDVPVSVRQATFAYVEGTHDGTVFIEAKKGQAYGFPNEQGSNAIKVGCHDLLREIDPDEPRRGPDPDALNIITDFCQRRFGIINPKVVKAQTCLYTKTPDEHFRIGNLNKKTVVVSACSGHGFKFGPWIGKLIADMCEEKSDASKWPSFSL